MFDKDNKAPKFVLTLPVWDKVLSSAKENKSFEINDDVVQEIKKEIIIPKQKSIEDTNNSNCNSIKAFRTFWQIKF